MCYLHRNNCPMFPFSLSLMLISLKHKKQKGVPLRLLLGRRQCKAYKVRKQGKFSHHVSLLKLRKQDNHSQLNPKDNILNNILKSFFMVEWERVFECIWQNGWGQWRVFIYWYQLSKHQAGRSAWWALLWFLCIKHLFQLYQFPLHMLGWNGRELIVERTRAGLAAAREKGRIGGRRPKLSTEQWAQAGRLIENGVDRKQVAIIYDVAVCSLYKKFPAGKA